MRGEPIPEFVKKEELLLEAQYALRVAHLLPDNIDGMSGSYRGKDLTPIVSILDILNIKDFREEILGFIKVIESTLVDHYANKAKQKQDIAKQQAGKRNGNSN